MSEKSDFGAFLIGFVVGGLTGAAVSLLFAPQSGEETRALIRDKAIEIRDQASETVEEARVQAEKAWEEAKHKTEEWSELAKEKAAELKDKGGKAIEEGRAKVAETIKPKEKAA
ncbi:MAG: YtxH domain-containing protein [Anaerolineaceae bacterium]|nr:YtxH domain-containing protein [Anaerolineaceae bacterium]